ncbi:class I SAM-dependent methyltransferase [Desulfovibrio sp. OttesenSCG-928-G15]|nr:class I SAM-dependent methyltransferase [Desulfovibrio sp. OttesenSCG-928-G15]
MSFASDRINALAAKYGAKKYLEIGVSKGDTFLCVDIPHKVAVDPNFRFDVTAHSRPGTFYYSITSDEFFSMYKESEAASCASKEHGGTEFDIIFIDGLHTFEQAYRDFVESLKFSHAKTVWILDDTVPCDPYSAVNDQNLSYAYRKKAGLGGAPWHGDVFKALLAIHDRHPEFCYCTIMDRGNPQTVLWRSQTGEKREPLFASLEEIDSLDYFGMLRHAHVFEPVGEKEAQQRIGTQVPVGRDASPDAWKNLMYSSLPDHMNLHKQMRKIRAAQSAELSRIRKLLQRQGSFNALQQILLGLATPFVRLLSKRKFAKGFQKDPAATLAGAEHPLLVALRTVLGWIGPEVRR